MSLQDDRVRQELWECTKSMFTATVQPRCFSLVIFTRNTLQHFALTVEVLLESTSTSLLDVRSHLRLEPNMRSRYVII